jgi:hypothetical protein
MYANGITHRTTNAVAAASVTAVRLERHPHVTARRPVQELYRPRIDASRVVTSSTRAAAFA